MHPNRHGTKLNLWNSLLLSVVYSNLQEEEESGKVDSAKRSIPVSAQETGIPLYILKVQTLLRDNMLCGG